MLSHKQARSDYYLNRALIYRQRDRLPFYQTHTNPEPLNLTTGCDRLYYKGQSDGRW